MKLDKGIQFAFNGQVWGTLYGGPFREFDPNTRRLVGLKMAQEIDHTHHFSVPTQDFSTPDEHVLTDGIIWALSQFANGYDVYVGCMGGSGRTGLFIGCMVKVLMDWCEYQQSPCEASDPVKYTRAKYKAHAIETPTQEAFVRGYDTGPVIEFLKVLTQPEVRTVEVPVEVPVEVVKTVYLTPWDYAAQWFKAWTR